MEIIEKNIRKTAILILLFISSKTFAQKLTTGIYASSNSAASTYAQVSGDVLETMYAGKYETIYKSTSATDFISESGSESIHIESEQSYKITDSSGNSTVMTLQLALPKLAPEDLIPIELPQGKAFITRKLPFDISGSYKFDGTANVITQLNADGTGKFQYAVSSNQAGTLFDIKWGILCNDAGQHLGNSLNGVHAYTLMIYTTKWEGIGLQINQSNGMIVINRDRFTQK